ncbi:MAG TPA: hypothetical protein ENJ44_05110 [Oceanospirillales bacterium]|nr:hypothetical protein [Oceanospirillales bacterium]
MNKMVIISLVIYGLFISNANAGAGGLDNNRDNDYRHITFVNQTTKHLKFKVKKGSNVNTTKSKTLHAHTANYISIANCNNKSFDIQIEHNGSLIQNHNGNDYTAHRKCGETLYIWHKDGHYHTGYEPHINADLSGCNTNRNKKPILFAHGYNSQQAVWGKFSHHISSTPHLNQKWRVFRTSVSQDGSMRKRAHMLAKYINKAAEQCHIEDGTLRVIAHSMGGLDIRYLVSNPGKSKELYRAAKKIERIYTLATPHKGDVLGDFVIEASDAGRDLTPEHMKWFNKKNKYENFKDGDDRKIHLLALRFRCGKHSKSDGVVSYKKQVYKGAGRSKHIYRGRHTDKVCSGLTPPSVETNITSILEKILADHVNGGENIPLD